MSTWAELAVELQKAWDEMANIKVTSEVVRGERDQLAGEVASLKKEGTRPDWLSSSLRPTRVAKMSI